MVPEPVEGYKAKPSPRAAHFAKRRGGAKSGYFLPLRQVQGPTNAEWNFSE